jgi:hypothetical protein
MPPDTPRLDFHNAGALKLLDPAPGYRAALMCNRPFRDAYGSSIATSPTAIHEAR